MCYNGVPFAEIRNDILDVPAIVEVANGNCQLYDSQAAADFLRLKVQALNQRIDEGDVVPDYRASAGKRSIFYRATLEMIPKKGAARKPRTRVKPLDKPAQE